jgi:hypothetical protein
MIMKNNKKVEAEIEAALNSLDDIKRAAPAPYLLTRIHARLGSPVTNTWESIAAFISRPSVMVAGLCLLITINISVLFYKNYTPSNTVTERSLTISADEEDEYNNLATIDNIENQ